MANPYGYTEEGLKHYTCHRAAGPISVDGHLDEESWQLVPRSPRFEDLEEPGRPALFDTRAAALWDDDYLYVGFWLEEPDLRATYTERDSMICHENDVEVFIAGRGAYFEFELNALGTIMERFYIWQDAYVEAGYAEIPEFDLLGTELVDTLGGAWSGFKHPRGRRWAFREWDMPGLEWAVQVDGTLNDDSDIDRGWTVEIAFPWQGLRWLADENARSLGKGDVWRIGLARREVIDQRASRRLATWTWHPLGDHDVHVPERYLAVELA